MKTVYVVPASLEFSMMTSGDRLEFDDMGFITVGNVRKYGDLSELMEVEGYSNVIPEAETVEQAIEMIEKASDWNVGIAKDRGVLALRVRGAWRKT